VHALQQAGAVPQRARTRGGGGTYIRHSSVGNPLDLAPSLAGVAAAS